MTRWAVVSLVSLIVTALGSAASGQINVGTSQPNRLALGAVGQGGMAQASVRIFLSGTRISGRQLRCETPPWLNVDRLELGTLDMGRRRGQRIYCDVSVSIDTAAPGEFDGRLRLRDGAHAIDVPVSAVVRAAQPRQRKLLVLTTPFTFDAGPDAREFEAWLELVQSLEMSVGYAAADARRDLLRTLDLPSYQVVMLGLDGLMQLRDEDITRLRRYVDGGGRLIVMADATMRGTVSSANKLLGPLGIEMRDFEAAGGQVVESSGGELATDRLLKDVSGLKFQRPSPLRVTDPHTARLLVRSREVPEHGWIGVARLGRGEIVAMGQCRWWTWLGEEQFKEADNAVLLRNLLTEIIVLPPGT